MYRDEALGEIKDNLGVWKKINSSKGFSNTEYRRLPSEEDWNPDNPERLKSISKPVISTLSTKPLSPYKLSERSFGNLQGVNSKLSVLIGTAIQYSPYDFIVIEGLRDIERQKHLLKIGASTTLNSRHLTGHAVDLAIWHEGEVTWEFEKYQVLNEHIQKIAKQHGIDISWGGDWNHFLDGVHWELTWNT